MTIGSPGSHSKNLGCLTGKIWNSVNQLPRENQLQSWYKILHSGLQHKTGNTTRDTLRTFLWSTKRCIISLGLPSFRNDGVSVVLLDLTGKVLTKLTLSRAEASKSIHLTVQKGNDRNLNLFLIFNFGIFQLVLQSFCSFSIILYQEFLNLQVLNVPPALEQ